MHIVHTDAKYSSGVHYLLDDGEREKNRAQDGTTQCSSTGQQRTAAASGISIQQQQQLGAWHTMMRYMRHNYLIAVHIYMAYNIICFGLDCVCMCVWVRVCSSTLKRQPHRNRTESSSSYSPELDFMYKSWSASKHTSSVISLQAQPHRSEPTLLQCIL